MKRFEIIDTDDVKFQINRWNDVSKQYEPYGRKYPTKELAVIAMDNFQEMYDEDNQESNG